MATELICSHKSDPEGENHVVRLEFQARNDEETEREDHILGIGVTVIVSEEASELFDVGHVGFTLTHEFELPE